jgi:ribonucleoside-diphosphate reductase alpha chain
MTAIRQLELWLTYQKYWCDHKPSVTVSVRDEEWMEVGAWVYKNFEWVSGISFLPYSEHTYEQAPYQEITEEQYHVWLTKVPKTVDWDALPKYEIVDSTISSQTLACAANGCDL